MNGNCAGGVTLRLLRQEYLTGQNNRYQATQFLRTFAPGNRRPGVRLSVLDRGDRFGVGSYLSGLVPSG